jgi:hypothetical protein
MQHAHVMHKRMCTLLLSAHESLQQALALYLSKTPGANFSIGLYSIALGLVLLKIQQIPALSCLNLI